MPSTSRRSPAADLPADPPVLAAIAAALAAAAVGWSLLRAARGRARLAAELQAERARLAAILSQLPAGVMVADAATGQLLFGNTQLEEIWRYPFAGGPLAGARAPWMRFAAPGAPWASDGGPFAAGAPAPLARALASGVPVLDEVVPLARADGTVGVQRVHAAPVRDATGRVVAGVAVVEDVTAAHAARATAARAAARLAELQHATAALGAALTVEDVGAVVAGRVAAALGAAAGALAVVAADTGATTGATTGAPRVVWAVDRPAEGDATAAGRARSPDLDALIADAARAGRPVYLAAGAAALPCVAAGEVLGVVALRFRGPCAPDDGDRTLGEMLAAQCAQALARVRLLDAHARARATAEASARHIAQLQRLTERVSTALTTADVMRVVGEDVAGAVAGASAAVYAARPTDGRLQLASEFGDQQACETDVIPPGATLTEAASLAAAAVATERLLVRDTVGGPGGAAATCVALPLGAGRGVVGALVLELRPPRALTPMEQDLLLAAGRIAAQGITRARLQSLREEERRRIARELHDEFGQTLTGLKLDLAYLERRLAGDGGAEFAPAVHALGARVDGAVDALRRIAAELRPGALDDLGLVTALEWQAGEFERRTGAACTLDVDLDAEVAEPAATAVFRVFQEALTNVARHARATHVHAWLTESAGVLRLRVTDDGVGLAPDAAARPGAMGLVGMRERAAALGGMLAVHAGPHGGTALTLELPYAPARASSPAPTSALDAAAVSAVTAAEPRPVARPVSRPGASTPR